MLIGTSQGHLYFYYASAIGFLTYAPVGLPNAVSGVVHSAVYLGTMMNPDTGWWTDYFAISFGNGMLQVVKANHQPPNPTTITLGSSYSLSNLFLPAGALRLSARPGGSGEALVAVGGSANGQLSVWRWQTSNPDQLSEVTSQNGRWSTGRVIKDVAWNPWNAQQIGLALRRARHARATLNGNTLSGSVIESGSDLLGEGVAWKNENNQSVLDVVYSNVLNSQEQGYQVLYVPDTFRPDVLLRVRINLANQAWLTYRYSAGDYYVPDLEWQFVSELNTRGWCVRLGYGVPYGSYRYAVATTSRGYVVFCLTPPIGLRGDYIAHQYGRTDAQAGTSP